MPYDQMPKEENEDNFLIKMLKKVGKKKGDVKPIVVHKTKLEDMLNEIDK